MIHTLHIPLINRVIVWGTLLVDEEIYGYRPGDLDDRDSLWVPGSLNFLMTWKMSIYNAYTR